MTIAVNRNLSNCEKSPKKRISGLQIFGGANPVEAPKSLFFGLFRSCLNCDSLRWSHTHFICIPAAHIISFCVSFLSRVDELNKLAGLQCMGLHSSGWWSTAALTQRSRVRIPLKPRNPFFRAFSQLLKLRFTAMVTYLFRPKITDTIYLKTFQ